MLNTYEERRYTVINESRRPHGRSTVDIRCPFCGTATTAYLWSLAANGKRCDGCDAIHLRMGQVSRRTAKEPKYD